MATLVLSAAVAAAGLTGFELFAASLAAVAVGTFIDQRLFAPNPHQNGPRLSDVRFSTLSEGEPIKRLYGRARINGNVIWTTNFLESKHKHHHTFHHSTHTYTYSVSFAVAFCEGNKHARLNRVWAENEPFDFSAHNYRFYPGSQTQKKDPKIVAVEGAWNVSAYRGIAYLVFEGLGVDRFGCRIPQITAEIIVPLHNPKAETLENLVQAVNLIPGTGEVIYGTTLQIKDDGFGNVTAENAHVKSDETDLNVSVQDLLLNIPNVKSVNLVVSWFGSDLRMNKCIIEPKVEVKNDKRLEPINWRVAGVTRRTANQVSRVKGRPAFGGTPSDHSIVEAIQYLTDRDIDVFFYPLLLMDIPHGNGLPDPYGLKSEQEAYPWRGRITVSDPRVDKTYAAGREVREFFGNVQPDDFQMRGTTVDFIHHGIQLGYRGMILHYAHLCAQVGKQMLNKSRMRGFYIGSEMRGLTRTRREGTGWYEGVEQLTNLMTEVKRIFQDAGLYNVQLSYAADWSEYHSHRPNDGTGDRFFNLDRLWAHPHCSFVAINNYLPISDWRDGKNHHDYSSSHKSIYDIDYLKSQIEGGEYYDYYYASEADRISQTRTPITNWIYRNKDIRSWWANYHYNHDPRHSRTEWRPGYKKIVFSEFGCPAVDKGTNQPNAFFDPKSSESSLPHFSNEQRDDQIQRVYYEAMITYWKEHCPTVGNKKMIDPADMFAWTWDARPFPAFPYRSDIWSDGENWHLGHWLNGRVGISLSELVKAICGWVGFTVADIDVTGLVGSNTAIRGYVIDSLMSPRAALNPLFSAYLFDGFETEGKLKFLLRANTPFSPLDIQNFVSKGGYKLTRLQETELPSKAVVSFYDEAKDYQIGTVGATKQTTTSDIVIELRFPLVLPDNVTRTLSEIILQEPWAAREKIELELPLSEIAFDPGDGAFITIAGRKFTFRMTGIQKGESLEIKGESIDTSIYDAVIAGSRVNSSRSIEIPGKSILRFMDLPLITGEEDRPWSPRLAVYQSPFPSAVNFYEVRGGHQELMNELNAPTQMGVLATNLPAGPHTVIDERNIIQLDMNNPNFQVLSDTEENVRNGANMIAVQTSTGDWEIIKFVNASLQSGRRYNLSRLFRGQLGTWPIMDGSIPVGQPVVFLDSSIVPINLPEVRKFDRIRYRYGPNVYAIGSRFYQERIYGGKATGQLPYPVADVQFFPEDGQVRITWKRQTRFGGEGFDREEVPLNEDYERYEIDLLNGADGLLYTAAVTKPVYVYVGAPPVFKTRIYQISASVGRGRPVTATYGG